MSACNKTVLICSLTREDLRIDASDKDNPRLSPVTIKLAVEGKSQGIKNTHNNIHIPAFYKSKQVRHARRSVIITNILKRTQRTPPYAK